MTPTRFRRLTCACRTGLCPLSWLIGEPWLQPVARRSRLCEVGVETAPQEVGYGVAAVGQCRFYRGISTRLDIALAEVPGIG